MGLVIAMKIEGVKGRQSWIQGEREGGGHHRYSSELHQKEVTSHFSNFFNGFTWDDPVDEALRLILRGSPGQTPPKVTKENLLLNF